MNVNLTPHFEAMIREKVESGRYNNASEVVREALRLLEAHDRQQVEQLRAALAIGLEQIERGEAVPYTPQVRAEIREAAFQKAQEGKRPHPDVLP
jgi:antitoxin ParD1/3/4